MSDSPKFCECLANLNVMKRQISDNLNSDDLRGFYVGIVSILNPLVGTPHSLQGEATRGQEMGQSGAIRGNLGQSGAIRGNPVGHAPIFFEGSPPLTHSNF